MNQRPFWSFLPYINNRTAWKPIGFPAIFIIPFGSDSAGNVLTRTQPIAIEVSILDTVRRNKVVGHQYRDLFFPDREIFTVSLSTKDIASRMIDISDFESDGEFVTIINRNGLIGKVPVVPGGLYYDVSDVLVDVENLQTGRYELSYRATVSRRIYDNNNSVICIDDSQTDVVMSNVDFAHPGEVIEEFKKNTPSIWFSNGKLAQEPLFKLYKPITDSLQNVYDEQTLLARLNFVNDAFPETIPYLSRIVGWDIPYFPKSLDSLRKSILRYTTYFQKNRGTLKSVMELYEMFGLDILIRNLWFDVDNSGLLHPSYDKDGIEISEACAFDILDADIRSPGFYTNKMSLLNRPSTRFENTDFTRVSSDVLISAFVVAVGSDAHQYLLDLCENQSTVEVQRGHVGYQSEQLDAVLDLDGLTRHQQVLVDRTNNVRSDVYSGPARIINPSSLSIQFLEPNVELTLDGHWSDPSEAVFLFAAYEYQKIEISSELLNRRSNYFDVKLVSPIDSSSNTGLILDYTLEFLYRIKAFHSLLRKFIVTVEFDESYLVTDFCYGPGFSEIPGLDSGEQQVPSPVTVETLPGCSESVGRYKESDYIYRNRLLRNLKEEFAVYLQYDSREYENVDPGHLQLQYPDISRPFAYYNEYGQDVLVGGYLADRKYGFVDGNDFANNFAEIKPIEYFNYTGSYFDVQRRDMNHSKYSMVESYTRAAFPSTLPTNEIVCFRGRAGDELALNATSENGESYYNAACGLTVGLGTYYITKPGVVRYGVANRSIGSRSIKPIISDLNLLSGGVDATRLEHKRVGINNSRISTKQELHYWDRTDNFSIGWETLADRSVSLAITKTNMHFPGTRFISMANLENDFSSGLHDLRPWDEELCAETLEITVVVGNDGNQYLSFPSVPFAVRGNGVAADIPSLSDHSLSAIVPNDVVHSIYTEHSSYWDTALVPSSSGQTVSLDDPQSALFDTALACPELFELTGEGLVDYIDGYPAVTGFVDTEPEGPEGDEFQALFLLESGIRDGSKAYRLDCSCNSGPCDDLSQEESENREQDCTAKLENNDINIAIKSNFNEFVGIQEICFDGSIPSLFELV